LPVWQSVRPLSRALTVHQGKGASDAAAQIGALLEGVESHAAEMFDSDSQYCRFDELAEQNRAPCLTDFAVDRACSPPPEQATRWVESRNLVGGEAIWLPFDLVSLDFTENVPSLMDRVSNGVATGATRDEAIATGLHELIERDSVTEWQQGGLLACMESTLDLETVPFGWFQHWHQRILAAGASVRCYHVPSITDTPVFACEINDLSKNGAPYRAIQGRACHPVPEIALFKALAEAVQGRATYIAGARDDLLPSDYQPRNSGITFAFGLPLPPGMPAVDFASIGPTRAGWEAAAQVLNRAGYGQIAVIDLAQPEGLWVVRVFVCGLASFVRRRRPRVRV
jgi:ribosomal protein S12 methylthiotransferase accessory factor